MQTQRSHYLDDPPPPPSYSFSPSAPPPPHGGYLVSGYTCQPPKTVYVLPSSTKRSGNDAYLYGRLPRNVILILSLILFLFATGLLVVEGYFYVTIRDHKSDFLWDWCVVPTLGSLLYFLTSFMGFSVHRHASPAGTIFLIIFSITAGMFSVVLVWSGWWGVNWGHAEEYPIIGGLGGLISICLALVVAQAKCCAPPPPPPPAVVLREPPYTRAHPPRDGATATPLIK